MRSESENFNKIIDNIDNARRVVLGCYDLPTDRNDVLVMPVTGLQNEGSTMSVT